MRSVQEILAELQAPPYGLTLVKLTDSPGSLEQWETYARLRLTDIDDLCGRWFMLQTSSMCLSSSSIRNFDRMETLRGIEAKYPPLVELMETVWATKAPFSQFFQLCEFFKCPPHLIVDTPTYCTSHASLAAFHEDQRSS